MSIANTLKIPTVSLQSESIKPKPKIVEELKNRFEYIYLLYDNDYDKEINWGRKFGQNLSDEYDFFQIEIPDNFKSKDFSDLVLNHGRDKAKEILITLLETPF